MRKLLNVSKLAIFVIAVVSLAPMRAWAGSTVSITGKVVDETGRPIAGAPVSVCDASADVTGAFGMLAATSGRRPNERICGTEFRQEEVTRSNGSFAFVTRAAERIVVSAGGGKYYRKGCLYGAAPDDALSLRFVLLRTLRVMSGRDGFYLRDCPQAQRPGAGTTPVQYNI